MKSIKFVEENFWIPLLVAMIIGLMFPTFGKSLNGLVFPILMAMLFLTYLRINASEIVNHFKSPFFILYTVVMYLLVIPAIIYWFFQFIASQFALAFLLLSAMPPGVISPLLTSLVKGNTSLSLAVSFMGNLVVPFTVLLLFFLFTQKTIQLDVWNLSITLLVVNLLPLIVAQLVRKMKKIYIERTQEYHSIINISLLTLIVYIIVAVQSKEILSQGPKDIIVEVFWLYILFFILQILGFYIAFWRKKEDKIALAVSKTYMNNALALGLAFTFFDPRVTLLMVLTEIPWNTTLGPFKYLLKYLK